MGNLDKIYSNTMYNVLGYIAPILILFVSIPVLIKLIGLEGYGIITFVGVISSFLSLSNLGMGAAATKFIPEYLIKKDFQKINKIINSNMLFFMIVGTIISLVFVLIFFLYPSLIQRMLPNTFENYFSLLLLISGIFFINLQNLGMISIFHGFQKFKISNFINIMIPFLNYSVMIVLAKLGYPVLYLVFGNLVVVFVSFIISIILLKSIVPKWNLSIDTFDLATIKENFSYGSYMFLGSLKGIFLYRLDKLLISFFSGTTVLTYYTIPFQISIRIHTLSAKIGGVLFPLSSELKTIGRESTIKNLFFRSNKYLVYLAAIIATPLIVFSKEILQAWIDPEFASNSFYVLMILSYSFFLNCLDIVSYFFLNGMGYVKTTFKLDWVSGVVALVLLFPLTYKFGIIGASIGLLISTITRFLFPLYYIKQNKIKFSEFMINSYGKILVIVTITFILSLAIRMFRLSVLWLIVLFLVFIVFLALFGGISIPEVKSIYFKFLNKGGNNQN